MKTREKRRLELNCDEMDSWHSWSPDGKWLAFSSNRTASKLTCVYLSHIDENGHSSPPLKIAGFDSMKANMPVFAQGWNDFSGYEIFPPVDTD